MTYLRRDPLCPWHYVCVPLHMHAYYQVGVEIPTNISVDFAELERSKKQFLFGSLLCAN